MKITFQITESKPNIFLHCIYESTVKRKMINVKRRFGGLRNLKPLQFAWINEDEYYL